MFYNGEKSIYIGFLAVYAKYECLADLFVGKFFKKLENCCLYKNTSSVIQKERLQ